MKSRILIVLIAGFISTLLIAQQNEIKEENFKVFGNCDECKDRIENALEIEEVKYVKWNKKIKKLTNSFFFQY
jgi:mercuric ion binding protein